MLYYITLDSVILYYVILCYIIFGCIRLDDVTGEVGGVGSLVDGSEARQVVVLIRDELNS